MPSPEPGRARVACAYPEAVLTAEWFQLVRRLRSLVARARRLATIRLVPLGAVPADADVVLVAAEHADAARAAAPRAHLVVVRPGGAEAALKEVVERLSPDDGGRRPHVVVRRGFRVVDWSSGRA
jgi:hypothetical protein